MDMEWLAGIENDFEHSPHTGWTRKHWMAVLEKMLLGVLGSFNGREAWPGLPMAEDGTELARRATVAVCGPGELLGRPMMLAAVYMAATGRTTIDGYDGDIAEVFRKGIAAVARLDASRLADSPYHPDCDVGTQMSILLAWDFLYEPLDDETKALMKEHYKACRSFTQRDHNWLLFGITQALLLERMGEPADRAELDGHFAAILNMYRGDGWFVDGWNQQFDSYNFWGFQLYLHLLLDRDAAWRERYGSTVKEITELHEQTFAYWVDADGNLVGHGRSLTYRFAAVCGLQWSQISGLTSTAPGLARRISSGCIKAFLEQGCLRGDGTMSIGFHRENTTVGEDYTGLGSPYWSVTGLMALLLPEDHPFWTDPELPSPADGGKISRIAVRGAQMALQTGGPRRESRMHIAGDQFRHHYTWEAGAKYYQHAYSSTLGFALAGLGGPELSAGRTGLSPDGETWCYRTKPRMVELSPSGCSSDWNAGLFHEGVDGRVGTESFFLGEGELHVFTHFSDRPQVRRLGGWSVKLEAGEMPRVDIHEDGTTAIRSAFGCSVLLPLAELGGVGGRVECVVLEPRAGYAHTHLFGGIGCWPQWTSCEPVAPGRPVAVFVDGVRAGSAQHAPDKEALLARARSVCFKKGFAQPGLRVNHRPLS